MSKFPSHEVTDESEIGAGRYLTFFLGNEEHGFNIHCVREIIGCPTITPIPKAPPSVIGVLDRRGDIIPVLDLHQRLDLREAVATEETCIIILDSDHGLVGVVVDRVSEVTDIEEDEFSAPPELVTSARDRYLIGIANTEGGVKLLLHMDQILADLRMADVAGAADTHALAS